MKVLIVDPDWRFATQASRYLESRAHLVVHQTSAEQTLNQIEHWRPDLVIVAAELVQTGIMEGLGRLCPRPAVLLTAWMDRYDIAWRAWQRGGDELLMKPLFNSGELHLAIVTALQNATAGTRGRAPTAVSA
ncbi:MAG: response regulator [Phycisphaerae bacterium]|nr:response regulator [Phycisphaerae bacterium]